ncbi:TetR/AcrR family transcriptional regulator [Pelagibacterium xiamenense]|uniref:TetR/AcrR family transcriptional regulator n=1 Tax=Pelagibacterium xiamenense TaxID=2901140 RepID=UPI001E28D0E4|nr:TetR/AcrR family transcriptional regulator [Pelagibacterium xiamenense]MCD7060078.1 TetR/AcrR family transcriptional regulator [Pelagibacterium xiamenense]
MDSPHMLSHPEAPSDEPRSKRAAILDAAAATFCKEGYAGASIDAIANTAGVSRQTIYNQIGDKEKLFKAVVAQLTEYSSARFFAILETFPTEPRNLEQELTAFAKRLLEMSCCDQHGKWLLRLANMEGQRHPDLFAAWRQYGPGRKYPAIAARFAQLAHAGYLEVDDPTLAARQFMALVSADIRFDMQFGTRPSQAEVEANAESAVRTFLRAFAPR